ncbi:DUF397 domain-containing protein [Streptomyces sp. NPDC058657]|uniref:DUF397 domain-containing protein n=1 Tax=unclassified Streptomyces TaxID=2593676 RepID=UPI003656C628
MNTEALSWFKSSYSSGEGGECIEVAYDWRKSTYSGGAGGDCIEVATHWHKSSHSSGEGGQCVEVANLPSAVHVRDSKLAGTSPELCLSPTAWRTFLTHTTA